MGSLSDEVERALAAGDAEEAFRLCLENNTSCLHGTSIERLRAVRRNQPPFLMIAMRRSGSTFIAKSVQVSGGYINVPFSRIAEDDLSLNQRLSWLKLGGVMSRVHSRPTPEVLNAIASVGGVRVLLLVRDPVDAAFSLFVRRRYNPRQLDEDASEISATRQKTLSRDHFMAFIEPAIDDYRSWLAEWDAVFPLESVECRRADYARFYVDVRAGFSALQAYLGLPGPILPLERGTITNYQRGMTEEKAREYATWLDELR